MSRVGALERLQGIGEINMCSCRKIRISKLQKIVHISPQNLTGCHFISQKCTLVATYRYYCCTYLQRADLKIIAFLPILCGDHRLPQRANPLQRPVIVYDTIPITKAQIFNSVNCENMKFESSQNLVSMRELCSVVLTKIKKATQTRQSLHGVFYGVTQ